MTEYWLQKKTIGGWSNVTWYDNYDQAWSNFSKLILVKGYSYRLVKVETMHSEMLDEVVDVEAPVLNEPPITGWNTVNHPFPTKNDWGTPLKVTNSWGDIPSDGASTHGLSGSVWVIHHGNKIKKRVDPATAMALELEGYERGGPKTKFRE